MKKLVKILSINLFAGLTIVGTVCALLSKANSPIQSKAESALINFAQKSSAFVTNTGIKEGAVSFSDDGIKFQNWASASGDTAAVYMTDKIEDDETIEIKFNFTKETSTSFNVALNFWDKVPNASLLPYSNSTLNGTGSTLNFNINNTGWFELQHYNFNSYKWYHSPIVSGNGLGYGNITFVDESTVPSKNGTLSGSQNIWDSADHTLLIKKKSTSYGVSLTIAYDNQYYLNDYRIEKWYKVYSGDSSLQYNPKSTFEGGYYLSTGFVSGGVTTDSDVLKIKSLTRSNRTLDSELVNLALDSNEYVTNTSIVEGCVTSDENGVHITNYADAAGTTAGIYVKEQVAPEEVFTAKVKSNGNASNRLFVSLNFFASIPHESFLTYKNSTYDSKGFLINIDLRHGWIQTDLRALKLYYGYDHLIITDGNSNIGSSGTLGGGYDIHDGLEHTITVSKKDITNGIALSFGVDGKYLYKDLEITGNKSLTGGNNVTCTPSNIQGDYYVSIAMIGDNVSSTSDSLDISSMTKSKRSVIVYNASAFALDLLDATDAICGGYDGVADNKAALEAVWTTLQDSNHFAKLSEADQNTFKNALADEAGDYLAKGVARYDYLVSKYALTNFASRTSVSPVNSSMYNIQNSSFVVLIIVSISLISMLSLAMILKKKNK